MKLSQAKLIVVASFCFAVLLMSCAVFYIYYDKELVFRDNRSRMENASAVMVEFVGKTLNGIDRVLVEAGHEVAAEMADGQEPDLVLLQNKFNDFSIGVSGLSAIFALDKNGMSFANSRPGALPKFSFADRNYFIEALKAQPSSLFISETVTSRVLNQWRFFASRPIFGPDGVVIGVMGASIETGLFQSVLNSYRPDPGIVISLFSSDFKIIARAPDDPSLYGRSFQDAELFKKLGTGRGHMVAITAPGILSGTDRFTIARSLPDLPVIFTISLPTRQLFAQWRAHSQMLLSLAGTMSAFIIFVGLAGARSIRRREEASSLLDTMFRQTPACLAIASSDGIVIRSNENWLSLGDLFAIPAAMREDVFKSLRHAVVGGADHGQIEDQQKSLTDIDAVAIAGKSNRVLELRCQHEGTDRYFTVNISRITLDRATEGYAILVVDISKQRALELRLRSQLIVDSQTGLANREGFQAALTSALPQAVGEDCLFVFDIVGLAELKETRGFEVSGEAFAAIGATVGGLSELGCIAGRIDSDKFCVFVPGAGHGTTSAQRLESLIHHMTHEHRLKGHTFNVRMTVGGARVSDVGRNAEKLIQAAEIAHGLAKRRGQASSAFFNAKIEADAHERVRLYESLQKAIVQQEFELAFQPKVDLASGEVIGAEALIRWRHPIFGLQPPDRFIPIAEESGLILPIGDWVMGEVLRLLALWPTHGRGPVPISVNVSPVQFDREDVDVILADHLRRYKVRPDLIVLELTESVFSLQLEETVAKINRIRETGVKVSLDDFGTGYSSLSYLNLMNFDELKVDGSFVRSVASDIVSRSIVDMTLGLARTLNVTVTAEAIETEEQRQALLSMGCSTGQGFLFAKPMPLAEFQAVIREQRRLLPTLLL